jgi:acetolactate synthase small subunit
MTPEGNPENGYGWSYKNPSAVVFSIQELQELAKMTTVTHNGKNALMQEFSDIIRKIRKITPNICVSDLQLRNALKQMGFLTFGTNHRKEVESITIITAKIAEVLS